MGRRLGSGRLDELREPPCALVFVAKDRRRLIYVGAGEVSFIERAVVQLRLSELDSTGRMGCKVERVGEGEGKKKKKKKEKKNKKKEKKKKKKKKKRKREAAAEGDRGRDTKDERERANAAG